MSASEIMEAHARELVARARAFRDAASAVPPPPPPPPRPRLACLCGSPWFDCACPGPVEITW